MCVLCRLPQLTAYMDSPSFLYIKRKWGHSELFLLHFYSHSHTHTQLHALYLSFCSFCVFTPPHRHALSSVRVKCERVSRAGCPLSISPSAVCSCAPVFHRDFPLCMLGGCCPCHHVRSCQRPSPSLVGHEVCVCVRERDNEKEKGTRPKERDRTGMCMWYGEMETVLYWGSVGVAASGEGAFCCEHWWALRQSASHMFVIYTIYTAVYCTAVIPNQGYNPLLFLLLYD